MFGKIHLQRPGEGKISKPLHILHLEDDPDFAELVRTLLRQDDLEAEVRRVASRAEFEAALDCEKFGVILSDFRLPSFTGLEVLAFVRKEYPDAPFILISGTIGEHAVNWPRNCGPNARISRSFSPAVTAPTSWARISNLNRS